jgi:serine/threonine protein kinase
LGRGSFGETSLIESSNGQKFVLKKSLKHNKNDIELQYKMLKNVEKIKSNVFIKPIFKKDYEFAMEYAEDFVSLEDLIRSKPNISIDIRKKMGNSLIQAVQLLHKNDIVHRDIKPANIMVNPSTGDVKLIDFGLSCTKKDCMKDGKSWGTVVYMPPDLINNYDYDFAFIKKLLNYQDYIRYVQWALGLVLLTLSDKNLNNEILKPVNFNQYRLREFYNSKNSKAVLNIAQKAVSQYFTYRIFNLR